MTASMTCLTFETSSPNPFAGDHETADEGSRDPTPPTPPPKVPLGQESDDEEALDHEGLDEPESAEQSDYGSTHDSHSSDIVGDEGFTADPRSVVLEPALVPLPSSQPETPGADVMPRRSTDHIDDDDDDYDYAGLLADRNFLKKRLEEEKQRRHHADKCHDERQAELQAQEAENKALAERLDRVEDDLRRARDHIFRMQPRRTQITETEAVEDFRSLVESIKRLVQNRLGPILDELDEGRLTGVQPPSYRRALLELVRPPAKDWFEADQSDEHHIMAVVLEYLRRNIFSKSFYCPLDTEPAAGEKTIAVVDKILKSMAELPRDFAQCRDWRSETLTALTHGPQFKVKRERYADTLTAELTSVLRAVVPRGREGQDLGESVRSNIIKPAMDLAHELHLATSLFIVDWPLLGNDGRPDLELCDCVNLSNSKLLALPPGRKKRIQYLFEFAPGLYVDDDRGVERRVLSRPRILVEDSDQGLLRKPTILSWLATEPLPSEAPVARRPGTEPVQNQDRSQNKKSGSWKKGVKDMRDRFVR